MLAFIRRVSWAKPEEASRNNHATLHFSREWLSAYS
jgi:hypothetical protein